jgi:hypothetical protein
MRTLDIKYGRGSMRIDVDEFFPTSKPRIRKLLKIMQLDWDTDRVLELLRLLNERVEDVRRTIAGGNINAPQLQKKIEEAETAIQRQKKALYAAKETGADKDTLHRIRESIKVLQKRENEEAAKYRACVKGLEKARREGIALLQDIEFIKGETCTK